MIVHNDGVDRKPLVWIIGREVFFENPVNLNSGFFICPSQECAQTLADAIRQLAQEFDT